MRTYPGTLLVERKSAGIQGLLKAPAAVLG